jgi:hypothetical protein
LFALIWLVPLMLARFFRESRQEAPLLAAVYVFSVALVPVALGRADPGHVFFSGFGIYLLSLVAISNLPPARQVAWVMCVVLVLTWTAYVDDRLYWGTLRAAIRYDTVHRQDDGVIHAAHAFTQKVSPTAARLIFSPGTNRYAEYEPFDLKRLQAIVGDDPVALPLSVPLPVQEALKRSGQFVPTFYDCEWSILDASAEDRQLKELNASRWALLPQGPIPTWTETPASIAPYLGQTLPYPIKRAPYVIGRRFAENLRANWQPYAVVGRYAVYRRRG